MDAFVIERKLRRKLENNEEITHEDLDLAFEAATRSGLDRLRVLYSRLKRAFEAQEEAKKPPQQPEPQEKVTLEQLKAAFERAQQTGRIEDRVAYAKLKQLYLLQNDAQN